MIHCFKSTKSWSIVIFRSSILPLFVTRGTSAAWTERFGISEFQMCRRNEGQCRFLLSRRARCHACTICYGFLSSSAGRVTLGLLLNGERLGTTHTSWRTNKREFFRIFGRWFDYLLFCCQVPGYPWPSKYISRITAEVEGVARCCWDQLTRLLFLRNAISRKLD